MRIFVAGLFAPEPDTNSGDKRFCAILQLLARNHQVDFWLQDWQFASQYDPSQFALRTKYARSLLADLGVSTLAPGWSGFSRATTVSYYHLGLFETFWTAEKMLNWFRTYQPGAVSVVDSVDVHFVRELAGAELGVTEKRHAIEIRDRELRVYQAADAVIAVSTPDEEILRKEGIANTFLVPNIQYRLDRSTREREPELLFVGGFRHHPNVDGILWFFDEVWPLICQRVPKAKVTVVGGDAPPDVRRRHDPPRVNIVGHVPDTAPYLDRAAVSIAPLRYGGGMKGKVSEALGAGLPVVTTAAGVSGFTVTSGVELLVADDPATFADHVVTLLFDPERAIRMGTAGQAVLQSLCGPDAVAKELHQMLAELVPRPQSLGPRFRWMQTVGARMLAKATRLAADARR